MSSFIYALRSRFSPRVYIGSTNNIALRLANHRCVKTNLHCSSKELATLGELRIEVLVEVVNPSSRLEVLLEEQKQCLLVEPDLLINRSVPGRTKAEYFVTYYAANSERLKANSKRNYAAKKLATARDLP